MNFFFLVFVRDRLRWQYNKDITSITRRHCAVFHIFNYYDFVFFFFIKYWRYSLKNHAFCSPSIWYWKEAHYTIIFFKHWIEIVLRTSKTICFKLACIQRVQRKQKQKLAFPPLTWQKKIAFITDSFKEYVKSNY